MTYQQRGQRPIQLQVSSGGSCNGEEEEGELQGALKNAIARLDLEQAMQPPPVRGGGFFGRAPPFPGVHRKFFCLVTTRRRAAGNTASGEQPRDASGVMDTI
eukprot:6845428-Prymnesium_polylepis.1